MMSEITGIGLMSGTSLDGLDIALCGFEFGDEITYRIYSAKTVRYGNKWREKLGNAQHLSGYELMLLDREFGVFCANEVKGFLADSRIKPQFVASHGHTVFHQPEKGISTQIGSGAAIAANTGIKTVCDFRSLDVELGGQGAPLVPIGDQFLFPGYDACLNIGGIANISFLRNSRRIAFDICSANMVLNDLSAKIGLPFDTDGEVAANGKTDVALFDKLNADSFYKLNEKKSIGREWVEEKINSLLRQSEVSVEDKLRTFTEHVALQVSTIVKLNGIKSMLVTGGGAYNKFLVDRIKEISGADIILPAKELIEFKEALIFALLGALRLSELENTLSTVTGARANSSGGAVYLPPPLS